MKYYVYIVRCSDQSLYTGWTTDVDRRVEEHNSSELGAKYTRAKRPVELVHSESFDSKSEAMSREALIKQMNKKQKGEVCRL